MSDKPYAPACDRNRAPILAVLRRHLAGIGSVLELGSGSGQHAVYFGAQLPHIRWQTSDRRPNHGGIRSWLVDAGLDNVLAPLVLDVTGTWPDTVYDAVFTANTLHIMDWPAVIALFDALPRVLRVGGLLLVYGPFHYRGQATSASNAEFDASLRARPGGMGVRDFAAVDALAAGAGLALLEDAAMPANNRCLVWRRTVAA